MENYELAVILAPKTTAAKKKAFTEKLEKLIKVNKGKIVGTDDWGVRDLAYVIAGNNSGYFLIFSLELEKGAASGLNQKLTMDEDVVRYLLVRTKKEKGVKMETKKEKVKGEK